MWIPRQYTSIVKSSWATVGKIGAAVVVGICLLTASGCGGEDETWTANAPSPDGRWLATAHTLETSGFGTGAVETDVFLKWTKGSSSPEHILGFLNDGRSIHLAMNWTAPTRLDVTYDGAPTVDFQVVKLGDVDISLRDAPNVQKSTFQPLQLPSSGLKIAPKSW